jgi:hypothetical protein
MGCGERGLEVRDEALKRPGQRLPPRDENIVVAGEPIKGKHRLGGGAKPPACTVPLDGATDLATGRKTYPDCGVSLFRERRYFQGESGHDAADSFGGAKEIGALFQALERRVFVGGR